MEIIKNKELPGKSKWRIDELSIGDSVCIGEYNSSLHMRIGGLCSYWHRKTGNIYSARKDNADGNLYVWRTA